MDDKPIDDFAVKWVEEAVATIHKRIDDEKEARRQSDIDLGLKFNEFAEYSDRNRDLVFGQIEHKIADLNREIAATAAQTVREQGLIWDAHKDLHRVQDAASAQLAQNLKDEVVKMQNTVESLREERASFVLRDYLDARLKDLEKVLDTTERSLIEKIEIGITTVRTTMDQRITANTDQIQKISQNQQVIQARMQQSIVALGILLTLVELLLRLYNP